MIYHFYWPFSKVLNSKGVAIIGVIFNTSFWYIKVIWRICEQKDEQTFSKSESIFWCDRIGLLLVENKKRNKNIGNLWGYEFNTGIKNFKILKQTKILWPYSFLGVGSICPPPRSFFYITQEALVWGCWNFLTFLNTQSPPFRPKTGL